jgi:2-amino-4-hydroxy-6-hydroxymethyldihydropteridine diphosphokinase
MEPVISYVGVGSNLGNALHNVTAALSALQHLPQTQLHNHSSLFRSAPIDATGDDFINAVARLDTTLSADLDLLLYGDVKISTDTLVVPHPRMTTRAFVILPLLELNPEILIPDHGLASNYVQGLSNQAIYAIPKTD